MHVAGQEWRLTKHGRKRYLERGEPNVTDREIILACIDNPQAIWKPDRKYKNAWRLVTYLSPQMERMQ